jgi:hypothetical protein
VEVIMPGRGAGAGSERPNCWPTSWLWYTMAAGWGTTCASNRS